MEKKNLLIALLSLGIIVIAGALILNLNLERAQNVGGAPAGLYSTLATTSTIAVGIANNQTLFTANKQCTSRIISTVAKAIMLNFGLVGNATSTGVVGHLQAASTTIAYDAEIYGCGAVTAYGFDATTTITTSEFR